MTQTNTNTGNEAMTNQKYTIRYAAHCYRTDAIIESGVRVEMAHSEEFAVSRVTDVVKKWSRNTGRVVCKVLSVA